MLTSETPWTLPAISTAFCIASADGHSPASVHLPSAYATCRPTMPSPAVSISCRILAAASSGFACGGKSFLPMSFTKSNRPIGDLLCVVSVRLEGRRRGGGGGGAGGGGQGGFSTAGGGEFRGAPHGA